MHIPTLQSHSSNLGSSFQKKDEMKSVDDTVLRTQELISRPTLLSQWKSSYWKEIKVGDFIFLKNNDRIPADIVIIASSEPDNTCYVETKNLDGETNLKIKRGLKDLSYIKTSADCKKLKGFINAEPPNNNLYAFSGTFISVDENGIETSISPLGVNSLLLRGCIIRNTSWIIGIAIYTGSDSKIMLNSGPTPSKRSKIDKQITPQVKYIIFLLTQQVLLNAFILILMCFICASLSVLYSRTFAYGISDYLGPATEPFKNGFFFTFFNCLIIYQNIIPIALYISLDVTKSIQVNNG